MTDSVIFLIEGGRALELVKHRISEVKRVRAAVRELSEELGVRTGTTDSLTGVLRGVVFPGLRHADFKCPNSKGVCAPRKGTQWFTRFQSQVGYGNSDEVICRELGVPTLIETTEADGGWRQRHIGALLNACGFLYISGDGPYAMWIPNVVGEVADAESDGSTVMEPAKSFKMEFDGCRRIHEEQWNLMVAEAALAEKLEAGEAK